MLNNAWPSLIWHLWDHALRPAGGYYGTKKACEPLHIQYDDGENTVSVVSDLPEATPLLSARVRAFDLSLEERFQHVASVSVPADGVAQVCELPDRSSWDKTHFLLLELFDPGGALCSRNFYWLSSQPDVIDQANANWYMAPAKEFADFHALARLPAAQVMLERAGDNGSELGVVLRNTGKTLAFFVRLTAHHADGAEALPLLVSENYVSLLPGEALEIMFSTAETQRNITLVVASGVGIQTVALAL
jgi:exo-1,4-beta-D-glucosaminidase